MSNLAIGVPGAGYRQEITIPALANAAITVSSASFSGNICTITTAAAGVVAAHGFTFTPSANVAPNLLVALDIGASGTVGTSISAQSGTGTLAGQIFRILSIPSTTTFTIYTTVTGATFSSTPVVAVFQPSALLGNSASSVALAPQTQPLPYTSPGLVQFTGATNLTAVYNPANNAPILDASYGNTPSTSPTFRLLAGAGSSATTASAKTCFFGPQDYILQTSATAGYVSSF